jgi:hypothetical protein
MEATLTVLEAISHYTLSVKKTRGRDEETNIWIVTFCIHAAHAIMVLE